MMWSYRYMSCAVITLLMNALTSTAGRNHVTHLISGFHYFDLIRDTPYEFRPPSVIAFMSESDDECRDKFYSLRFNEHDMPSRLDVFLARYDIHDTKQFSWFKFTDDMDLPALLNISTCPTLAVIDPAYNGRENATTTLDIWDINANADWRTWAKEAIKKYRTPDVSSDFTNELLITRDNAESRCHYRISLTPSRIPSYTSRGFKLIDMPDALYDRLMTYYKKWDHKRTSEPWDLDQTETNYHATHMSLVSLDHDYVERDNIANDHVRPLLSEWANVPEDDMHLKSFYGIREYYRGNELRTHIDVINTHVLSAVLCIAQEGIEEDWMLEVIDHHGDRVEIACKPKQVILYESASLPHGRPKPFKGEKFVNAFVHYQPRGWDFTERQWGDAVSPTHFTGPFGLGQGAEGPCGGHDRPDRHNQPYEEAQQHQTREVEQHQDDAYDEDDDDYSEPLSEAEYADESPMAAAPPKIQDDGRRKVIFTNMASSARDLFWLGDGGMVFQAEVQPGNAIDMNTFVGHKFMWTTIDHSKPHGDAHKSGPESLRGERVGEIVEITKAIDQQYQSIEGHDEL